MTEKKYNKSELIGHLYEVAQDLIRLIEDSSKENQAILLNGLKKAKTRYLGNGGLLNWIATSLRWRGPEFDKLIKILEFEKDLLLRLQAFRTFIQSGGWASTSANTTIYNEIIKQVSKDFIENDNDLKKFIIQTLKTEMINIINEKEAEYNRSVKRQELEYRTTQDQKPGIATIEPNIILTNNRIETKVTFNKSSNNSETIKNQSIPTTTKEALKCYPKFFKRYDSYFGEQRYEIYPKKITGKVS